METESTIVLFIQILFSLAILAFVALLAAEKYKPYRHFSRKIYKDSLVTNTTAFLFNNVVMSVLRGTSLFFIAQQFSSFGFFGGKSIKPIEWVMAFLLYDFGIYVWHVASHKFEFLWRFHKIHHSDKTVNVSTGFRFHVFDLFLELLYKSVLVTVLGVEAYLILVFETIQLFFIFFHHSNLSFENEKKLSRYIITPYLHRVHHSTLRSDHDSNYGIVLAFWDQLFGTRKELVPVKIGLDTIMAENFVQLFSLAFITEQHIKKLLQLIPKGKSQSE